MIKPSGSSFVGMPEDLSSAVLEPPPSQIEEARRSAAFSIVRDVAVSVCIAVMVIIFLYQPVKVEGTSMMPSLVDQERIFVNKFLYRFGLGDISRGDTIVFWYPGDTTKSYIKRVVGLPGDQIRIESGKVRINGKPLDERYVPDQYRSFENMENITVPPGQYFVLGDHRSSSNDSRAWGTVPKNFIYGKAVFVYWPLERVGPLP
jgi:signal peptidase I